MENSVQWIFGNILNYFKYNYKQDQIHKHTEFRLQRKKLVEDLDYMMQLLAFILPGGPIEL